MGAFDVTVELGRAGWQDEPGDLARLAGLLELGGELAAAVDLQGADREGHALKECIEELRGRRTGPNRGLRVAQGRCRSLRRCRISTADIM